VFQCEVLIRKLLSVNLTTKKKKKEERRTSGQQRKKEEKKKKSYYGFASSSVSSGEVSSLAHETRDNSVELGTRIAKALFTCFC
jgi:hypothetical protein